MYALRISTTAFGMLCGISGNLLLWRRLLLNKWGRILASLWFPAILVYSVLAISMLILRIAGTNNTHLIDLMIVLVTLMFLPILSIIPGSLAYDVQNVPPERAE